uniref:Uncharacterized protein n=1 Tax=Glossina morsitans morsitans TaxID=37546 RepID=A0A1B0F994_GLOMM
MLSQQKTTTFTSSKEDGANGDYPSCSKLPAKKANVSLLSLNRKYYLSVLKKPSKEINSTPIANKTSFQPATRKREFQEKDCETELKDVNVNDVKDRMECKFKKIAKGSAQVEKNTDFQTSSKEEDGAPVSSFTSRKTPDAVETSTRKFLGSRRAFFPRSKK